MSNYTNHLKVRDQVEKSCIKEAKKKEKDEKLIKPTRKYTKKEQEDIINKIFGTY